MSTIAKINPRLRKRSIIISISCLPFNLINCKRISFIMAINLICLSVVITKAQPPVCNNENVYIFSTGNIYNWDPTLPASGTNPVLNAITMQPGSNGLAISEPLGGVNAPSPTFYTVIAGNYWFWDGVSWTNSGHNIGSNGAVNIGAGGGYIYGLDWQTGQVYKYDGTGNASLLITISGGGLLPDLHADCAGNFYIANSSNSGWLRKYSPSGTLLQQWTMTGGGGIQGGGMAIVGDVLYFDKPPSNPSIRQGVINPNSNTIVITTHPSPPGLPASFNDMAACQVGSPLGRWKTGGPDVTDTVVRGCKSAFVNFHRNTASPTPYGFRLMFSGTAINGQDYEQIPDTFFIPANQTDAVLEIKPLLAPATGTVQAIIEVVEQCEGIGPISVLRTITVDIEDSLKVNIITPLDTFCPGETITIEAEIEDGLDFTWQPSIFIQNSNQLTIQSTPSSTTTYSITVTQPGAPATCPPRTAYYTAVVEQYPKILVQNNITACIQNDSLDLTISVEGDGLQYQYKWSPPTYLRNDYERNNKFYAPPGTYKKIVSASSPGGCTSVDSFTINVLPPFEFDWVSPRDTTIWYGDSIQLNSESDAIRWTWYPGRYLSDDTIQNPWAKPLESMTYTVKGYDKYGCSNTAEVRVNVDYMFNVGIPNAFSPNGDGLNDVFNIKNLKFEKILVFQIYNRWGEIVFETRNPNEGWNGFINNKPADVGVYYYNIGLATPDGKTKYLKGDITLIR